MNLVGCLRTRDIGSDAVDQALIDDVVGIVTFMLEHHGRDVVVLADSEWGGDANLTHDQHLT